MLREVTAIKGVWASGKLRGSSSHVVIGTTSPPAGHFESNPKQQIHQKVTFALNFTYKHLAKSVNASGPTEKSESGTR